MFLIDVIFFLFAGYYCDGSGLVKESGPCAAGFYCPAGQSTSSPQAYICPKGFECPTGSAAPSACVRGKIIVD